VYARGVVEWEKGGGCKGFAALADPHLRFLSRDCARLAPWQVFEGVTC
jgi:hypothetical protein